MKSPLKDEKIVASGLTDRRRWVLILAEIAVCYILIYVSVYFNWPKHDWFRYLTLIPLYQAGVAFGYTGGIVGGIIITLLFVPVIPVDPMVATEREGIPGAVALVVFINLFGIFVGGAIGAGRKAQNRVNNLSRILLNIARETTEKDVMARLASESLSFMETQYAAALIRNGKSDPTQWEMIGIEAAGTSGRIAGFSPGHPLVWSARTKESLATGSISSDPRFKSYDADGAIRSALTVPVVFESEVYGALLLSNRKNDELFTKKDLSMVSLLAGAAAASIHNKERELKRQELKVREEQMKDLFSRFVSASVADFVMGNPELLKGRWQEVTILVSDIRDFTRISESLSPHQIVEQLNEYFTMMVDAVFENEGTIDKFIGDCLIAYWGAPAPDDKHAVHAARAALEMSHTLGILNKKWASAGKPVFRTGIALHTCSVLIGNIGDDRKKAFTILGREVREAMDLESLTKTLGAEIIMSEETGKAVSGEFKTRRLASGESEGHGAVYSLESE